MSAVRPRLAADRIAAHEARGEWPMAGTSALLAERARRSPDRVYVVDGDRRVTFAEAQRQSLSLALGLLALGIGPGDVVSWQLPSWFEAAILTAALDRIGAVGNPILSIYRAAEVAFVVRQARSRVLVVPGIHRGFDHRELAREVRARSDVEHLVVARAAPPPGAVALERLLDSPPRELPPSPLGPHDVATIFYTSGTTSEPKGVLHTPSTLGSFARLNAAVARMSEADVSLLQFPVTHVGGIGSFVLAPLLAGSTAVYLDPWDPESAIRAIEREAVTSAGGPPAVLQGILGAPGFRRERLRTLRAAASGAADVSPELVRRLRRELGIASFRSYGMTECPMVTSGTREDPEEKAALTDGRPVPGCRLRIVGADGRDLPPGVEGEVLVFGPQLCVGYVDGALDAEAFATDGFFATGDLGILDGEGYLRVTGRKKDVIIRKGENLSARAIEDLLHEHPAIAEVAVIGVPDAERGERVCACVVPRAGAVPPTLADLAAFMTARGMMRQKVPEQLEVLSVLPRNATGKVKKQELRARFAPSER